MLRLHINRGLHLLTNPQSVPGTGAAVVVATGIACVAAGLITVAVAVCERLQYSTGPLIAKITLGAIVGLLALGVLEHRWHDRFVLSKRVYTIATLMAVLGVLCAVAAFVITAPATR